MPEGVEVKYYKKTISTTDGKSYEFVLPVVKSPGIVAEVDAHGTQTYTYGYTEDNWESMDAIKTVLGIDTTMVKLPFLVDITRFSGEDNQQTAMKAYSKLYEYFPNLEKITNFDSDSVSFDILPSNPGMTFKNLTNRLSAGGSDTSLSYVNAYPVVRVSVHPFYIRNRYNLNFVLVGEFTETYTNVHQIKIACDPDTPNSTIVFYSKSTPLATGLNNFLKGAEEVEPGPEPGGGDDPYNPGGTSGGGGGQGSFDGTGDDIGIPSLPTLDATDSGFVTLFTPTISELKSLATYMWTNDLFNIDTWKKIFANPMDAILGLTIVPVAVPTSGQSPVTVGNINTGVSMTKAAQQYVELDCGSVTIPEYWGAYLDYDPYTKLDLYLPYVGIVPVKADEIIGRAIHIVYHVDILSGALCCMVQCGKSVMYQYTASCATQIPVSGVDMTNSISSILRATGSVASMVAGTVVGGAVGGAVTAGAIVSTAQNVMGAKPTVQHSGTMSGPGGMLGVQTPYFIITRPNQCVAANQNGLIGYPAFFTVTLGDLSGYAELDSVHLTGIPATGDEMNEIERLLKEGAIF